MTYLMLLAGDRSSDKSGLPVKFLPLIVSGDRPHLNERLWLEETGNWHRVKDIRHYFATGTTPAYIEIYLAVKDSLLERLSKDEGWIENEDYIVTSELWTR